MNSQFLHTILKSRKGYHALLAFIIKYATYYVNRHNSVDTPSECHAKHTIKKCYQLYLYICITEMFAHWRFIKSLATINMHLITIYKIGVRHCESYQVDYIYIIPQFCILQQTNISFPRSQNIKHKTQPILVPWYIAEHRC